jgi:hypothetical protein
LIAPTLKVDERFKKRVQARYGRYDLEAGVLKDKPHRDPKPAKARGKPQKKKRVQGAKAKTVRLQKAKASTTNAEVSERIRKDHGVDYLRSPLRMHNSLPMKQFRKAFGRLLTGKDKNYSSVESKFRAVIRIPILKLHYGRNSAEAARTKTFNRKLFDTGQFFKAIISKVRVRKNKNV